MYWVNKVAVRACLVYYIMYLHVYYMCWYMYMYIVHVYLLNFFLLSYFFKLVCYAHVFPCTLRVYTVHGWLHAVVSVLTGYMNRNSLSCNSCVCTQTWMHKTTLPCHASCTYLYMYMYTHKCMYLYMYMEYERNRFW